MSPQCLLALEDRNDDFDRSRLLPETSETQDHSRISFRTSSSLSIGSLSVLSNTESSGLVVTFLYPFHLSSRTKCLNQCGIILGGNGTLTPNAILDYIAIR